MIINWWWLDWVANLRVQIIPVCAVDSFGVWNNQAYMPSVPLQESYRCDETLNTTPKMSEHQYSWWCAGFCLPTTWSPLKSLSYFYSPGGMLCVLHPLGGAEHTMPPVVYIICSAFFSPIFLSPSFFQFTWMTLTAWLKGCRMRSRAFPISQCHRSAWPTCCLLIFPHIHWPKRAAGHAWQ